MFLNFLNPWFKIFVNVSFKNEKNEVFGIFLQRLISRCTKLTCWILVIIQSCFVVTYQHFITFVAN